MSLNYKEDGELKPLAKTEVAKDKYSTDEIVVGEWIDGKPIYRKVFVSSSLVLLSASTWINFTTTNIPMKQIVNLSCNNSLQGMFIDGIYARYDSNSLALFNSRGKDLSIDTVIVEYTKTTD